MPTEEPSSHEAIASAPPSQLNTILLLFLLFRLTLLFLYTPQGLMNAYTDYYYYYRSAQLSDNGYYPFVNMWYEYPPLLAYAQVLPYRLVRLFMPSGDIYSLTYRIYALMLGMLFLLFEAGVLILLHRLAHRLWDVQRANWLAWVYSSLSLPVFFWAYSHQSVPTFFCLLSLLWFLDKKQFKSGMALGLGAAAKFIPIILLLPYLYFSRKQWREVLILLSSSFTFFIVVYVPFILLGGQSWIVASFSALRHVASYGTVWALLDGNWGPGSYGPLLMRLHPPVFQPGAQGMSPYLIWIVLILFAGVSLYLVWKTHPVVDKGRHVVWLSLFTWVLFHLWSKGWSPQWGMTLIPLMLLSFPNRRGLFLVLALSGLVFLEWPVAFALSCKGLYACVVIMRTLVFIGVIWLAGRKLWFEKRYSMIKSKHG